MFWNFIVTLKRYCCTTFDPAFSPRCYFGISQIISKEIPKHIKRRYSCRISNFSASPLDKLVCYFQEITTAFIFGNTEKKHGFNRVLRCCKRPTIHPKLQLKSSDIILNVPITIMES
jgi:hypothetical protein